MLNVYRRQARTHAELNLGPLAPLDKAIPELRPKKRQGGAGKGKGSGSKRLPNDPNRLPNPSPKKAQTRLTYQRPQGDLNSEHPDRDNAFEAENGSDPSHDTTPDRTSTTSNVQTNDQCEPPDPLDAALLVAARAGDLDTVRRLTEIIHSRECSGTNNVISLATRRPKRT